MVSLDENIIKKLFSNFFVPSYKGKLKDADLLKKIIMELQKEPSPTSSQVIEEIKIFTKNKVKLKQSNIKRIRTRCRKLNLIKIPKISSPEKKKIKYLEILNVNMYNFPPYVRSGQKSAMEGDKYKVNFMKPRLNSSIHIPSHLQGVQFYKTFNDAQNAINEKKKFSNNYFKKNSDYKNKLKINIKY
tara:strand:- start:115 stop:675 length:561 start_codon:yes stop_codon:yes gene_type:complete